MEDLVCPYPRHFYHDIPKLLRKVFFRRLRYLVGEY